MLLWVRVYVVVCLSVCVCFQWEQFKLFAGANGSCWGWVFYCRYCLSDLTHDNSKTDAARFTKLDIQMFHDKSWKLIYFGVKRSKVTSHKNTAGMVFALLWVLAAFGLSAWSWLQIQHFVTACSTELLEMFEKLMSVISEASGTDWGMNQVHADTVPALATFYCHRETFRYFVNIVTLLK